MQAHFFESGLDPSQLVLHGHHAWITRPRAKLAFPGDAMMGHLVWGGGPVFTRGVGNWDPSYKGNLASPRPTAVSLWVEVLRREPQFETHTQT